MTPNRMLAAVTISATPTRPYLVTTDIFWELVASAYEGTFIVQERQQAMPAFWAFVDAARQSLNANRTQLHLGRGLQCSGGVAKCNQPRPPPRLCTFNKRKGHLIHRSLASRSTLPN